jgi:hypothetical protein
LPSVPAIVASLAGVACGSSSSTKKPVFGGYPLGLMRNSFKKSAAGTGFVKLSET